MGQDALRVALVLLSALHALYIYLAYLKCAQMHLCTHIHTYILVYTYKYRSMAHIKEEHECTAPYVHAAISTQWQGLVHRKLHFSCNAALPVLHTNTYTYAIRMYLAVVAWLELFFCCAACFFLYFFSIFDSRFLILDFFLFRFPSKAVLECTPVCMCALLTALCCLFACSTEK